jgi:hypothetical protein
MKKSLFVLLAALAAATLVCKQSDVPDDWSEFTEETVKGSLDALAAADSVYRAVMTSQGVPAAAELARARLDAHASVAAVGIARDSSVTAFFANGLVGTICELDRGTRDSLDTAPLTQGTVHSAAGEVIASAVVLTPFAHAWGTVAEDMVADLLDTCFGGLGGATERVSDAAVSVDKVREVLTAGPGVLLWSSHGALIFKDTVNWDDWVALLTGESYGSEAMAQRIVNNYSGGARASGGDRELVVAMVEGRPYLAVTPKFVTKYGNFNYMEGMGHNATKSIVYACCCHSGLTTGGLPAAFQLAGADIYLGWSREVKALFAAQRQVLFFRNATDTCTATQAYYGIGNVTDPWHGAQLLCYPFDTVMIRSQMRFSKDGTPLHGYSVGVALASGVTTVNCFASPPFQEPQYGVTVHFPGAGPGSWNCTAQEDAEIFVFDYTQGGKWYVVQKDFVGVSGSIEAARYDADVTSGRFSGTLGHWTTSQDPEKDPPDETIEIQNGIFKYTGLRQ